MKTDVDADCNARSNGVVAEAFVGWRCDAATDSGVGKGGFTILVGVVVINCCGCVVRYNHVENFNFASLKITC